MYRVYENSILSLYRFSNLRSVRVSFKHAIAKLIIILNLELIFIFILANCNHRNQLNMHRYI